MSKDKRYSLTLDLHIDARNDREAMVKAAKITEQLRKEQGNEAQTLFLHETPFASLSSRLVHTGRLTLFNNKLIQG